MLGHFGVSAVGVLLGLCACTSSPAPVAPAPSAQREPTTKDDGPAKAEPTPKREPSGGVDEAQWRCREDDECTQTCALGAVNATWLQTHADADTCDDGCGWKSDAVACRDGGCVTLTTEGGIDPSCTRRTREHGP
jgi:hypothetical protein